MTGDLSLSRRNRHCLNTGGTFGGLLKEFEPISINKGSRKHRMVLMADQTGESTEKKIKDVLLDIKRRRQPGKTPRHAVCFLSNE